MTAATGRRLRKLWSRQKKIDEIYKWADRKRQYYDEEYQETNSPETMRMFRRYDDICDICEWASEGEEDE